MDKLNLILIGKSGAGKTTLANALMGEDALQAAKPHKAEKTNGTYCKKMLIRLTQGLERDGIRMVSKQVTLFDAMDLELDAKKTQAALRGLHRLIQKTQADTGERDSTILWYCVNYRGNRFERYEADLVHSLMRKHRIPAFIVITRCLESDGELEQKIKADCPGIPVARVMAKECKTRGGVIQEFGVHELLALSVLHCQELAGAVRPKAGR